MEIDSDKENNLEKSPQSSRTSQFQPIQNVVATLQEPQNQNQITEHPVQQEKEKAHNSNEFEKETKPTPCYRAANHSEVIKKNLEIIQKSLALVFDEQLTIDFTDIEDPEAEMMFIPKEKLVKSEVSLIVRKRNIRIDEEDVETRETFTMVYGPARIESFVEVFVEEYHEVAYNEQRLPFIKTLTSLKEINGSFMMFCALNDFRFDLDILKDNVAIGKMEIGGINSMDPENAAVSHVQPLNFYPFFQQQLPYQNQSKVSIDNDSDKDEKKPLLGIRSRKSTRQVDEKMHPSQFPSTSSNRSKIDRKKAITTSNILKRVSQVKKANNNDDKVIVVNGEFFCALCNQKYVLRKSVIRHAKKHHPELWE